MGQYANFYNSRNGDRVYNADSMSEWLLPFFTTGVFNNCFAITANDDMSVTVDGGYANIKGKTKHFEQEQIFTLEKASGTLARIDNVILRRDDTERDFYIFIETGGFSKNPVAPEIVRTEAIHDLKLGEIRVEVGAIKITQENITDTRMNADVCGWVMATVKEIDFSQITAQFDTFFSGYKQKIQYQFDSYTSDFENYAATQNSMFTSWFNNIKNQLSTDAAGNLQNQLDALEKLMADITGAGISELNLLNEYLWELGYEGSSGTEKIERGIGHVQYSGAQSVKVVVRPGKKYKVYTYYVAEQTIVERDVVYVSKSSGETTEDNYDMYTEPYFGKVDINPTNGINEFVVTVPDGYDRLLVNSWDRNVQAVKVYEIQDQKDQIKTLWSGTMVSGTISFNVPQECFHENESTLTLLIEAAGNGSGKGDMTAVVSIRLEPTDISNPNVDTEGFVYKSLYVTEIVQNLATGNEITVRAKKVSDSRYAVCNIEFNAMSGNPIVLTCISAIIPTK